MLYGHMLFEIVDINIFIGPARHRLLDRKERTKTGKLRHDKLGRNGTQPIGEGIHK